MWWGQEITNGLEGGNRHLGADGEGGPSAASCLLAEFLTLPHSRDKPRWA